MLRHEVRRGTPVTAKVSRSAAPAPASHSAGRRRASHAGDSSRTAGRSTQRQTSSSAAATTTVTGSHATAVRQSVRHRQTAHEQRQVRRHRADRDRRRHERRAQERQRDDGVARGEGHAPPVYPRTKTPARVFLPRRRTETPPGQRSGDDGGVVLDLQPVERDPALRDRAARFAEARHQAGVDQGAHDRSACGELGVRQLAQRARQGGGIQRRADRPGRRAPRMPRSPPRRRPARARGRSPRARRASARSRRNGSAACAAATSSISARVRNVKTLRRSTTSASSVLSQNWYIAYGLVSFGVEPDRVALALAELACRRCW